MTGKTKSNELSKEPLILKPVPENTNDTEKPIDLEKKPKPKVQTVQYYVKFTFILAYILFLTTGTITFIEALRTEDQVVRNILNLETCISVVAGYFYSLFTVQIEEVSKKNIQIDWAEITKTRYIDWSITTPLMLLVLCLVLGNNIKKLLKLETLGAIVILNFLMLYIGYLGETEKLTRINAMIGGFLPFIVMFGIIFYEFVKPKYIFANYLLYGTFVSVWSMYGFVYLLNEEYKNIAMNILDTIAKCFIGLGLWAYYTKVVN
jgi:bacteriorhodopsin